MTIPEIAQVAMPYIYTLLWPVLMAIAVAMSVYARWGELLPRAAMLGVRFVIALMAAGVFALSLTTGVAPVLSIQVYRPLIVSIRVAMLFAATGALCAMIVGLHAHWRARRSLGAKAPERG